MQELLKCDKIQATEEFVCKRLMEWSKNRKDKRLKQNVSTLLKLIQLEYIPSQVCFLCLTSSVTMPMSKIDKYLNSIPLLSQSQIFDNASFVAFYKQFDCSDILFNELKRRAANQSSNVGDRRCRSVFCLFTQHKGDQSAECSAIKIEKYNGVMNCFEEAAEISLGGRSDFEVVLQQNQVYVLAGYDNVYLKSVSVSPSKLE